MRNDYVGDCVVPYYSQQIDFLSKEGSLKQSQIDEWTNNLCGLMCVGMIINRFSTNSKYTIAELLDSADKLGAFHQRSGWIHKKLVLLAEKYGVEASCQRMNNLDTIYELLAAGGLIIASVSPSYLSPELKITADEQSGHLVVISGMNREEKGSYQIFVHDPGSEFTEGGKNLSVDSSVFVRSFSGNIIVFKNPQRL